MAATVVINEYNTVSETKTANITNSNMGSTDAVNLNPTTYPVIPGENTYEKYQKIDITSMGGSSKIDNLKVWRTGALGGAAVHLTNARLIATYAGAAAFATPTTAISLLAVVGMPTTVTATANLGIGGTTTGSLTTEGISDYLVHQIQTNVADVAGSTSTMNYQYDETA
jgi:hypothetical protein